MHLLVALLLFLPACAPTLDSADSGGDGGSSTDGGGSAGDGGGAGDGGDGGTTAPYHPEGYDRSDVHGHAAKFQEEACLDCHGADLAGGSSGVACDACHGGGWDSDCTFCHGGSDNGTGAPPEGIDDVDDDAAFGQHGVHVEAGNHAPFSCDNCHAQPADCLSPGHVLVGDDSPGAAEVSFSGGLSPEASWSGAGCSNLYCHGDGAGNLGTVSLSDEVTCGGCHPVEASWWTGGWLFMGGEHVKHLWEGILCADCHADTVSAGDLIDDPAMHVNGRLDVALPEGIAWSGGSCTGECHGEQHDGRGW